MVNVLPAPHAVGQQGVPAGHPAPYGVHLVLAEGDAVGHAREGEVRAIELAEAEVVVGVVIPPHEPLGAVGVGEHPAAELLLDQLLLLAGGQAGVRVHHPLVGVVRVRVVDDRGLHVEGEFEQPVAVGPVGAVIGGGRHGPLGRVVRLHAPQGVLLQVGYLHAAGPHPEQVRGERLDVGGRNPRRAQVGVDVAGEHVLGLHLS